jgi:hypothetical protein
MDLARLKTITFRAKETTGKFIVIKNPLGKKPKIIE